jgi:hypothetical protein
MASAEANLSSSNAQAEFIGSGNIWVARRADAVILAVMRPMLTVNWLVAIHRSQVCNRR